MRCPRFSPGRASSEYRVVAPPLCLYAFRGTTVGIRGGSAAVLSPTGPDMAHRTPRAAEIGSLNIAPLLPDFGSIGRAPCGRPIQPKSGSRGAPHAAHWGSQYAPRPRQLGPGETLGLLFSIDFSRAVLARRGLCEPLEAALLLASETAPRPGFYAHGFLSHSNQYKRDSDWLGAGYRP